MTTWIARLYSDFLARDLSYVAGGALIAWTWAILLNRPDLLSASTTSGAVSRIVVFYFLGSILRDLVVGATSLFPKRKPDKPESYTWAWTYLRLSKEVDEDDLPDPYRTRYLNMLQDLSGCYASEVMKHLERIIFGVTSTSSLAAAGLIGFLSVAAIFLRTRITEQPSSDSQAQPLAFMVNLAFVFVLWPSNRELTRRLARRYRSLAEEIPKRTRVHGCS